MREEEKKKKHFSSLLAFLFPSFSFLKPKEVSIKDIQIVKNVQGGVCASGGDGRGGVDVGGGGAGKSSLTGSQLALSPPPSLSPPQASPGLLLSSA